MILTDEVIDIPLQMEGEGLVEALQRWREIWRNELDTKRVAPTTKKAYMDGIDPLIQFAEQHAGDLRMDQIGAKFINRSLMIYQISLAEKKKHAKCNFLKSEFKKERLGRNDAAFTILERFESTLSHRSTIFKMFFRFIGKNNREGHDYISTFPDVSTIKIHEKDTMYLTQEEMKDFIAFASSWPSRYKEYKNEKFKPQAYRDSLLLLLYALTGARGEEVATIRLKDIKEVKAGRGGDVTAYDIRIRNGKGGKPRTVSVQAKYVKEHIEYLRDHLPSDNYYIASTFKPSSGYTDKPSHVNNIRAFANQLMRYAGIDKNGLHALRRGYATKRINETGGNALQVSKELGNTVAILEKHYFKHDPATIRMVTSFGAEKGEE